MELRTCDVPPLGNHSSHCESSQLSPPLTGPGPGLLNSLQPYCLIRIFYCFLLLLSQCLRISIPCPSIGFLIMLNTCGSIHREFSMGWLNTGLPVNERFLSNGEFRCSGLGLNPMVEWARCFRCWSCHWAVLWFIVVRIKLLQNDWEGHYCLNFSLSWKGINMPCRTHLHGVGHHSSIHLFLPCIPSCHCQTGCDDFAELAGATIDWCWSPSLFV